MKKAKEYFEECFQNNRNIIDTIKQVQEDTIRETVKECAENAIATEIEERTYPYKEYPGMYKDTKKIVVDKNLILSVADKLIKEL